MKNNLINKKTVFYCVNCTSEESIIKEMEGIQIKFIKMSCSSMVKEVLLLRAFEAEADSVLVFTCAEGKCNHVQGNTRARKRVVKVQKLLNEIGIGAEQLSIHSI